VAAVAVSLKPSASSASPVIANLAGDLLNYDPGTGAQLIDQGSNATVTDADSPDFNGGALTVSFISGSDPSEDGAGDSQPGYRRWPDRPFPAPTSPTTSAPAR